MYYYYYCKCIFSYKNPNITNPNMCTQYISRILPFYINLPFPIRTLFSSTTNARKTNAFRKESKSQAVNRTSCFSETQAAKTFTSQFEVSCLIVIKPCTLVNMSWLCFFTPDKLLIDFPRDVLKVPDWIFYLTATYVKLSLFDLINKSRHLKDISVQ